jgi:ribosomal protein S18 acetylase RimI-like enzyme
VEVRELTAAERGVAIEIWSEAELTRPWNDPVADFDRALAGPSSTLLGAFIDGELVATAMVGHDGHRGWLYYVAVRSAARRQGLGRVVIAAAESWLRDRGIPKVQLMVRRSNAHAVRFYDEIGYEDDDVIVLSRWLD